jgi:hypothetical protein
VADEPDAWEWGAGNGGPTVTVRAGGPLDGVVTLGTIDGGHGRCRLEVEWTENGERHTDHVEIDSFEDARIIAQEVADEMRSGHRPDLTRD